MTMKLDDLTIGEAKELAKMFGGQRGPRTNSIEVGKAYFFRTVTMHITGRVVAVTDFDVKLEDAAWIADSGRFYQALTDGTLNEVEPYPHGTCIALGSVVDYSVWNHELPQ